MLSEIEAVEIISGVRSKHDLKDHEVITFAALLFSADQKMECSLTVGEIAELCRRGKTSVRRSLRSLEEKGLLRREAQYYEDEVNARAPNKYTLRIGG